MPGRHIRHTHPADCGLNHFSGAVPEATVGSPQEVLRCRHCGKELEHTFLHLHSARFGAFGKFVEARKETDSFVGEVLGVFGTVKDNHV